MTTREEALLREALERLRNDLAFAAPEAWMLHVERRFTEYADALAPADGLERKPGRWAFLDEETGDWIEVKAGVVWAATPDAPADGLREALTKIRDLCDGPMAEIDRQGGPMRVLVAVIPTMVDAALATPDAPAEVITDANGDKLERGEPDYPGQ